MQYVNAPTAYYRRNQKLEGFSLVELSIVLVIIGLLTGGILSGQSLIRAAELRAVTSEYEQYKTAVMTFRDKYLALPGDMKNATKFWGSTYGATTCEEMWAANSNPGTCNGNGNGKLNTQGGNQWQFVEMFLFWQHLAKAGLIQGEYEGFAHWNRDNAVIGANVPGSRLSNAGWTVYDNLFSDHTPNAESAMYGTTQNWNLEFGGQASNYELDTPVLTPQEAWGIDTKIDDGNGSTGNVVIGIIWGNCRDSNAAPVARQFTYNLPYEGVACTLFFLQ